MSAAEWWGILGVFLGGATPWLEAPIVIPTGLIAGLPVVPVLLAAIIGNLLTVGIAAYFGEAMRSWFSRRRASRRRELDVEAEEHRRARTQHRRARTQRRRARIEKVMDRGGLPLLALVGPVGLGTQVSAVVAVALGVRATTSFLWVSAGTVLWCVVAAYATLAGVEILGFGG